MVQDKQQINETDDSREILIIPPSDVPNAVNDEDSETAYLASDMYRRIVALINNFEADMPDDLQAGGRLVSAGNITFSIQDVGFWDPNMIVFYGELSDGSHVELVQHLSQLNLLLVAVKRTDDTGKPRRIIGFATNNAPGTAEEHADK